VWFDEMSAARAMLKLSRAHHDVDLHQFIASSSTTTPAAAAGEYRFTVTDVIH